MDVDWDTDDRALYDGMQFTGELVESAGDGNLASLYAYRSGFPHGPHRRPPAQGTSRDGLPVGVHREWHPEGQPASKSSSTTTVGSSGRAGGTSRATSPRTRPFVRDDDHIPSWLRRQWDAAGRSDA